MGSKTRFEMLVRFGLTIWLGSWACAACGQSVEESADWGMGEVYGAQHPRAALRVRAHIGNPDTVGPWSEWTSFLSPTQPVAVAPTTPTTTGGTSSSGSCIGPFSAAGTRVSVKPNDSDVPRAVVAQYPSVLANSCQPEGGGRGTWEFMDRTVDALRQRDGRYGYNAKRGNMNDPSLDVISFYRGADPNGFQGSSDVYIFDLISGHCGSTPSSIWATPASSANSRAPSTRCAPACARAPFRAITSIACCPAWVRRCSSRT